MPDQKTNRPMHLRNPQKTGTENEKKTASRRKTSSGTSSRAAGATSLLRTDGRRLPPQQNRRAATQSRRVTQESAGTGRSVADSAPSNTKLSQSSAAQIKRNERKEKLRKEGKVLREEWKSLINKDAVRPDDIIRVKGGFDRPMFIIILILVCFGSVMVFTSSYAYALSEYGDSYYFIRRQLFFVAIGMAAMLFVTLFVDYRFIRKVSRPYFLVVTVMLMAVLLTGLSEGDAQRWLRLGPIVLQPSEFMKLGLALTLADLYQIFEKQVRDRRFFVSATFGTIIPALLVAFVCVLIILENHLSGTIIMFLIGVLIIFCGGGKVGIIAVGGGVFAAAAVGVITMTDYASKRIDIWLHPENYSSQSETWQTLQGLYAVGSGGMLGVGLGEGRQKHLFVSQPQNDFIYSIICEELGFVGAVLVIALFAAFIWRGFHIALKAPDTFSRLTVIGIVGKVGLQALLNIAVVTATIPNTGITLPFFSYGGSSLTILLMEMGIVLAISRYSIEQK